MTRYAAFLRGVNLGKRQVKSADLLKAFTNMGFDNVKTLLASGNVLFDADSPDARQIEAALERAFSFAIGTVLRSQDQLKALIDLDPFDGRKEDENTKLYVTFVEDLNATSLPMPCAVTADFEVVKLTDGEVCIVTYRKADGRYGSGMDLIWKHYGKKRLWTSRNWNTVLKAAS
ncbi:DUF1697 domain-containing protein [Devosia sp.]|uniref:DUF1697 domain-containing protein n=1 Tax=Devosia sp. TaxID=1871048 RepID=UPI0032639CD4